MKISHDPRHNVAYIRLQERTGQVLTLKIRGDWGQIFILDKLNSFR